MTSKDFYYCNLCRQSDIRGRKHVYSKQHKNRLAFVLHKFGAKIQAAESLIGCPEVIEGSFEKGTNYWCYLCSCDVERHAYDGQVTLKLAKFIEHLCSESHSLAAPKFYRLHHVEPGMVKQRLVFSQEDYERFKTKLVQALDQYEDKTYAKLQESAAKIRKVEAERQAIVDNREAFPGSKGCGVDPHVGTASVEHGEGSDKFALSRSLNYAAGRPKVLNKVRTIAVVSSGGLASIGTHTAAAREGNVHSGATPPWLRESSDPTRARDKEGKQSEVGGIIGPTAEDFQKDLERRKKRKLNPNRVGANFDHMTPTSEEWLPSFGRVWNSGRRWQSRHQFRKERMKKGEQRKAPAPHTQSKPP